jgi:hypothetical protein
VMASPQVRQIHEYDDVVFAADQSRHGRHVAIATKSWS